MSNLDFFIAVVPAIILHEVSHGWVAYLFGDPTAKEQHRLSLNPVRHVDPFGTLILPALLVVSHLPAFGYAKPVPVNVSRLRKPRAQSLYVSLAGPAMNLLLVGLSWAIAHPQVYAASGGYYIRTVWIFKVGYYFGLVNLLLAAFNLIPIPPARRLGDHRALHSDAPPAELLPLPDVLPARRHGAAHRQLAGVPLGPGVRPPRAVVDQPPRLEAHRARRSLVDRPGDGLGALGAGRGHRRELRRVGAQLARSGADRRERLDDQPGDVVLERRRSGV